jgi:hypothetical protein
MKSALLLSIILLAALFFIVLFSQELTYVGVDKCKICHKTEKQGKQFVIWEQSKHSQSFAALSSEKAMTIAQEAGVANPGENSKCLQCHAPLFEKAAPFKPEGVTCEVCHGPGSGYKSLNVMKNREEAVKNGLVVYESPEAIKKHCLTCHEKAHGQSFDFNASWEVIKHAVPEKQ